MRPNIILIMADQWGASSLGCYGCPVPGVTPHLDALAQSGVRFGRHYANAPVCGPSRATIFTGRSPALHGVFHNNIEISRSTPLFTQALQNAGYHTKGIGKFHFSPLQKFPPRDLEHLGFDEVLVTEDPKHGPYLDYIRENHPEHYQTALAMAWPMPYLENYPPRGQDLRPQWRAAHDKHLKPAQDASGKRIFYASPLPADLHQSAWITDRAIETLEAKSPGDQPFFLFVSYVDPHDPYDPPAPYSTYFSPSNMPPPRAKSWRRDFCAREYAQFEQKMFEIASFEASDWARLRALFFGSCRFVDDQIGRVLETLRRTMLSENTVVIFTTDHGEALGDQGLLMKGPWHFDSVVRCPLLLSGPGIACGAECEKLSCTLDLAPTITGLAGLEFSLEGQKLPLSVAELEAFSGWSEIAIESNASYVDPGAGCRTLVSAEGWRLSLFPGQKYGELFDLKRDPDEQINRFSDPMCREVRADMAERLVAKVARQVHPFPRGEFAGL